MTICLAALRRPVQAAMVIEGFAEVQPEDRADWQLCHNPKFQAGPGLMGGAINWQQSINR
jgi:hypothetical protein